MRWWQTRGVAGPPSAGAGLRAALHGVGAVPAGPVGGDAAGLGRVDEVAAREGLPCYSGLRSRPAHVAGVALDGAATRPGRLVASCLSSARSPSAPRPLGKLK